MKKYRSDQDSEALSLSFMDAISNALGAAVLLFLMFAAVKQSSNPSFASKSSGRFIDITWSTLDRSALFNVFIKGPKQQDGIEIDFLELQKKMIPPLQDGEGIQSADALVLFAKKIPAQEAANEEISQDTDFDDNTELDLYDEQYSAQIEDARQNQANINPDVDRPQEVINNSSFILSARFAAPRFDINNLGTCFLLGFSREGSLELNQAPTNERQFKIFIADPPPGNWDIQVRYFNEKNEASLLQGQQHLVTVTRTVYTRTDRLAQTSNDIRFSHLSTYDVFTVK